MLRPRILIVDDNETQVKLAVLMARRAGVASVSRNNITQAMCYLLSQPGIEIVLVDLGVPRGVAGRQALRRLVHLRRLHRLNYRIVAMTAHAMPEDRDESLALGADGYLSKPYSYKEFVDIVLMRSTEYEDRRLVS